MAKKQKFNLKITRVKLNAEQAILGCCFVSANKTSGHPDPCSDIKTPWDTDCAAGNKSCGTITSANALQS